MAYMKASRLSDATREAVEVLGAAIRAARLHRGWTVAELAERVGVTRQTMTKVEHGDTNVAIATYFEAATLVGVALFDGAESRGRYAWQKRTELGLLPASVRRRKVVADDDF
jgi:transcriptional regulator with XRE-family HTH domain